MIIKTLSLKAWSTRPLKEFCRAEGKGRRYSISASPAHDTKGAITGNIAVLVDTTE